MLLFCCCKLRAFLFNLIFGRDVGPGLDNVAMNKIAVKGLFLALFIPLCSLAVAFARDGSVQKEMLDRFVRYASIDSQSSVDSICTFGQHVMASAILEDINHEIAAYHVKGVTACMSPENYVYVRIPATGKHKSSPSLGISCHLDVTPEATGGVIKPVVDMKDGHTIVRTDGSTLLGADDKCGCTIAMQLIHLLLSDKKIGHGEVMFVFCPNEDVGRAADAIDVSLFNPDILFDLDGPGGDCVTKSNFTARGYDVKFIGREAHPSEAKSQGLGDATAAASTYIAFFPVGVRPENTEGLQGYIHPWSFEKRGADVTVQTRVRYFDPKEGEYFDSLLRAAVDKVRRDFPNVGVEILYDGLQYENIAYTLHPKAMELVENAARNIGVDVVFADERGGTTASMFAAKGIKGGMCVFTGQHNIHSTREYADLQEMEDAYRLMVEIIKGVAKL